MLNTPLRVVICVILALSALSIVGLEAADLTPAIDPVVVIGGTVGLLAIWHEHRYREGYLKWRTRLLGIRAHKPPLLC